jgi:hypothetical protein
MMSLSPPQLGELAQKKRKAAAMKDLDFTAKKVQKLQDDLDKARAAAATAADLEAQLEKAKVAMEDAEVLRSAAAAKGNKKAKEKTDKQEATKKKKDMQREKAAQEKKKKEVDALLSMNDAHLEHLIGRDNYMAISQALDMTLASRQAKEVEEAEKEENEKKEAEKKKKKEENEKKEAEKNKKKEEDERVVPGECHDDETEEELDKWEDLRQRKWWGQASALCKKLEAKGIDPWQSRPEAPERTDKEGKEDLNPNLNP